MKIVWALPFVFTFSGFGAFEQVAQDIRQQVKERGQVEVRITKQYSPLDLEGLVAGVDLVSRGVVEGKGSWLDENKVLTDYKVQVISVIRGGDPSLEGRTITIRRDGGKVQIDGGRVTAYEPDFPFFEIGEEYILFLKRSADQLYVVRDGAQGAFRIEAGRASQVSKRIGTWNRERGPVEVAQFVNEIAVVAKK
jgi:hypothetical protein